MKYEFELKGTGLLKIICGPIGSRFDGHGTADMQYIVQQFSTDADAIDALTSILSKRESMPDALKAKEMASSRMNSQA